MGTFIICVIAAIYCAIACWFAKYLIRHPEGNDPWYWVFVVLWPILVIEILFSDED